MTTNRKASLALILGSLAGLVTMTLHPTSRDVLASLAGGGHGNLNKGVHALALLAQPLILMGTLVMTLRFTKQRDLAVAAYVLFAWASIAIMMATAASGFIATEVLATGVNQRATPDAVRSALQYTGILNRTFASVYIFFGSLAIMVWSVAMLRANEFSRALAVYGLISGLVSILVGANSLGRTIHGFAIVVVSQGVWFLWVAFILRRLPQS